MIQNRGIYGAGGWVLVVIFIVFFLAVSAGAQDPSLRIISPNGGQNWNIGEHKNITWEASGFSAGVNGKIELWQNNRRIGTIMNLIIPSGTSGQLWIIGDYQGGTAAAGSGYKIRISTMDGRVWDESDRPFTLRTAGLSTAPSGAGTATRGPQPQAGPQPQTQTGPQPQTGASRIQRHPSVSSPKPDLEITDAYYDNVMHKLVAVVENQRATSTANYRGTLKIAWQQEGYGHQRQEIEVSNVVLMTGQSKHIALTTLSWPPDTAVMRFEIEVDPDNEVAETKEDNNRFYGIVHWSSTPNLILEQNKIEIGSKELRDGGTVTLDRSDIEAALDRECEHTFAIKVQFRLINRGARRADTRVAIHFGDYGRRGKGTLEVSLNPGQGERYTKTITVKDPGDVDVRVYEVVSTGLPKDFLNGHLSCSSSLVDYVGRPAKLALRNCRIIDESGAVAGRTPRQVTLDWPGNLTLRAEVTNSPYYGPVRSPWKLFFKVQCQHGSEVSETFVDKSWDYNNTPDPGADVTRTFEFRPDKPYESCTFKVRIESTSCPTMIQGDYEKEIHFALD
jgi:hypothetical protein